MSEIYVVYRYLDPFNPKIAYITTSEYDAIHMIKTLQKEDQRVDYEIAHYIEDKDY